LVGLVCGLLMPTTRHQYLLGLQYRNQHHFHYQLHSLPVSHLNVEAVSDTASVQLDRKLTTPQRPSSWHVGRHGGTQSNNAISGLHKVQGQPQVIMRQCMRCVAGCMQSRRRHSSCREDSLQLPALDSLTFEPANRRNAFIWSSYSNATHHGE
jgi:hypothetical protein